MSGIEVAGLLLGALPVLFEAVDFYRTGIQRSKIFFGKRTVVNKLALALLLQQQTLTETIKSILTRSGCEEVWRLEADPIACLQDVNVKQQVLEYLGADNHATFIWALEQSNEVAQRVARNLAGLVPAVKDSTDSLFYIIKANKDAKQRQLDLLPRVKLMLSISELKQAIQDLDNSTNSFCRFTTIVSANRQPVEHDSSRKAVKLGKALRKVRRFAIDLHQAIVRAWRAECHDHEAKLFLEDRIDTAAEISKAAWKSKTASSVLIFHMIFTASASQTYVSWHQAPVQVSHELMSNEDEVSGSEPNPLQTQGVRIALPVNTQSRTIVPCVDNICALMQSTAGGEQVALVLSKDQKMGKLLAANEKLMMPCSQCDRTVLAALLAPNAPTRFPLRSGMLLALRLASNLLQLSCTPWLRTSWSKDTIYFLCQPGPVVGATTIEFTRPFVSLTFDGSNGNGAAQSSLRPAVDPKSALLELGILLLEIWHSKTLEAQFSLPRSPVEYYERLAWASKWLDDMTDPLPELYDKAVSHCVRGMMGGETRLPDWEDGRFWSAFCQDVIEPLYKNCKQWR